MSYEIDVTFYNIDAPALANNVISKAIYLSNFIPHVVAKLGEESYLYVSRSHIEYFSPKAIRPEETKSATDAGDWY